MSRRAAVVAVQGDVRQHIDALERAFGPDVDAVATREPMEIAAADVVVLPGGESTTISQALSRYGLAEPIRAHVADEKPLLATCAGLIVAASEVPDDRVDTLGLLDARIARNAFGRQRESFEAPLAVDGLDDPYPGVFIRAPRIDSVGAAEVLATLDGDPVAVRDGPVTGACFHPELTGDPRFHRLAVPGRAIDR